MAFPTITTTTTASATVQNLTANIGSPANGDLVVLLATRREVSVNFSVPSGWTSLYGVDSASGSHWGFGIYRVCNGTEGATVELVASADNGQASAIAINVAAGTYTGVPVASAAAGASQVYWPPEVSLPSGAEDAAWIAALHAFWDPDTWPSDTDADYTNRVVNSPTRIERANKSVETERPPEFGEPFGTNGVIATIAIRGTTASGPSAAAKARYRRLCTNVAI